MVAILADTLLEEAASGSERTHTRLRSTAIFLIHAWWFSVCWGKVFSRFRAIVALLRAAILPAITDAVRPIAVGLMCWGVQATLANHAAATRIHEIRCTLYRAQVTSSRHMLSDCLASCWIKHHSGRTRDTL